MPWTSKHSDGRVHYCSKFHLPRQAGTNFSDLMHLLDLEKRNDGHFFTSETRSLESLESLASKFTTDSIVKRFLRIKYGKNLLTPCSPKPRLYRMALKLWRSPQSRNSTKQVSLPLAPEQKISLPKTSGWPVLQSRTLDKYSRWMQYCRWTEYWLALGRISPYKSEWCHSLCTWISFQATKELPSKDDFVYVELKTGAHFVLPRKLSQRYNRPIEDSFCNYFHQGVLPTSLSSPCHAVGICRIWLTADVAIRKRINVWLFWGIFLLNI